MPAASFLWIATPPFPVPQTIQIREEGGRGCRRKAFWVTALIYHALRGENDPDF